VHFDDDTDILERLLNRKTSTAKKTNLQIIKEVELRLEIEQRTGESKKQVEAGSEGKKGAEHGKKGRQE